MKIQKKIFVFWGGVRSGGGGGSGWGGQGGWEWRIEAFVKIQKNFFIFFGWGGSGREGGGVGFGVRVDVKGE